MRHAVLRSLTAQYSIYSFIYFFLGLRALYIVFYVFMWLIIMLCVLLCCHPRPNKDTHYQRRFVTSVTVRILPYITVSSCSARLRSVFGHSLAKVGYFTNYCPCNFAWRLGLFVVFDAQQTTGQCVCVCWRQHPYR